MLYSQLERDFGAVTYEAWLALLVDITRDDASSLEQLREAFKGMAREKVSAATAADLGLMRLFWQPYVTELDFRYASLPSETIKFLEEAMPVSGGVEGAVVNGDGRCYDCEWHIHLLSLPLSLSAGLVRCPQ